MRVIVGLALAAGLLIGASDGAWAEGEEPEAQEWSFNGVFGTFDMAATQRGLQIYQQVCSACHSLDLVAYRNLEELGFNEEEVKAIAAQRQVTDGPDDAGDMFQRPARPSDHFVAPYENENQAKAFNNGALPPDLSLMAKARDGGADYIFALLTGYEEAPAEVEMLGALSYNPFFPGQQIAMPNILFANAVPYSDGTEQTVEQYARDVANFLMWTAEPALEERKRTGLKVMLFLIVFAGMMYGVKRRVWANLH